MAELYEFAIELSGSVDAGFVPVLPFHHGYLEPDCVERRGGGAYARDKNTSARLCAKNAGGAYVRGGAYLRDTTVPHQTRRTFLLLLVT